ncbi:MAG: GFA family protein, partial [Acetobacteraceae bacterium]
MAASQASHRGECFCGAVTLEVTGEPEAMGYCHCRSCRSWSGAPLNAFSLWKPEAVKVTAGAAHLATFKKTAMSERQYCRKCGGHLMTRHPTLGLIDVFSATLPTLVF